jgi:hypothetical protein
MTYNEWRAEQGLPPAVPNFPREVRKIELSNEAMEGLRTLANIFSQRYPSSQSPDITSLLELIGLYQVHIHIHETVGYEQRECYEAGKADCIEGFAPRFYDIYAQEDHTKHFYRFMYEFYMKGYYEEKAKRAPLIERKRPGRKKRYDAE